MRTQLFFLTVVALFTANLAFGGFIPCNLNGPPLPGFTCDLYSTSDGSPTGTPESSGPTITLPLTVGADFVYICANPVTCTSSNPATWADVADITTNGTNSFVVFYTSSFPSIPNGDATFKVTSPSTFCLDSGCADVYDFFAPAVPEPATLPLIGGGLAALGFLARWRRKTT